MSDERMSEEKSEIADESSSVLEDQAITATDSLQSDPVQAPMSNLQADPQQASNETVNLDGVLDIPVSVSVEIGKTTLSIRSLLQLNQGSVVELDRLAGESLDVLVNGTLVAHGEVVVVNEKFGIRLTDVVSAQERVRQLA
ncbi:MAG: flagellar motor switch protein FliN/FliY [Gammaproteobacteria bacterium]|jgi:flagellar motor switch protein FliN/FliY